MKNNPRLKYYRVYKNCTAITEVALNGFTFERAALLHAFSTTVFSLPADSLMFTDYPDKVSAMKNAKTGALRYIKSLIAEVENGMRKLREYREEHYEDLNINLLDSNISRLEREIRNK